MQDFTERHCQQVTNALVDIINIYPHKNIFIYPILDTLLLYAQKPRIISFYASDSRSNEPTYTSLKDPEIYPAFMQALKDQPKASRILIPTTDIALSLHELDTTRGTADALFSPVSSAEMADVESILLALTDKREETGSGSKLLEYTAARIKEGTESGSSYHNDESLRAAALLADGPEQPPSQEMIAYLLEPLRVALDDAFGDYIKSPLLAQRQNRDLPFPNIFCVVQHKMDGIRRGCFDYTARVLLSTNQMNLIGATCGDATRIDLELPLGPRARSIADSVFASGIIDFSSEEPGVGRDDSGFNKSPFDKRRHAAEERVYGVIVERAQVFYIPVHVGGVPWLALFTLSTKEETNLAWAHNFRLYRTLIPRINERLRAGVKRVYLHLVGERLSEALNHKDGPSVLSRINQAWKQLTYVYPHKGIRFVLNPDQEPNSLQLPDGRRVSLELYDNPYYQRQIDYDLLDEQSVWDKVNHALTRASEKQAEVDRRFKAEVLSQRHTIFNRLPQTELSNAIASDISELSGDTRIWVEDAKHAVDILNVSLKIALRRGGEHPLRGQSLLGVLDWLKARILSSEKKPVFDFASEIPNPSIKDEHLSGGFIVIWNLWHNASKTYPLAVEDHFVVRAVSEGEDLVLTFINEGELPEPWSNFLRGNGSSPSKREEQTGLELVRDSITQLGWSIIAVKVQEGHTYISIAIPGKDADLKG